MHAARPDQRSALQQIPNHAATTTTRRARRRRHSTLAPLRRRRRSHSARQVEDPEMPPPVLSIGSPRWDARVTPGTPATTPTTAAGSIPSIDSRGIPSLPGLSGSSESAALADQQACQLLDGKASAACTCGWTRGSGKRVGVSKLDLHSSLSQRLYEATASGRITTRARKLSSFDGGSFATRRPSLALVMTIMLILIFVELQIVLYARQRAPSTRLRGSNGAVVRPGGCAFVWADMQCSHGCCPRKFERSGNTVVACDVCVVQNVPVAPTKAAPATREPLRQDLRDDDHVKTVSNASTRSGPLNKKENPASSLYTDADLIDEGEDFRLDSSDDDEKAFPGQGELSIYRRRT